MITIEAPVTVNQFDEQRFARMEQAWQEMRNEIGQMRLELQEVLKNRQEQVDQMTKELKQHNDALETVVNAIKQKG